MPSAAGVLFPKFRGDLVQTAVVVERMRAGAIESLRIPANPVDVLAQQVVAMCAMDEWTVADVEALVHRTASFAGLPRSVLEATLDMLAGQLPLRRVRRAAPAHRLGPRHRHAHRAAGAPSAWP